MDWKMLAFWNKQFKILSTTNKNFLFMLNLADIDELNIKIQ